MPRTADGDDEVAQPLDLLDGQSRRRLVEQKKRRPQHQRACYLHETQLAVLQSVRSRVGELFQPDHCQRRRRRLGEAASSRRWRGSAKSDFDEAAAPIRRAADHDVFEHGRFADQPWRLERAGDAIAGARMRGACAAAAFPSRRDPALAAARSSRRSTFSVVVLPLPLGPISPCTSPVRTSRLRPSIARTPPKLKDTFSSEARPSARSRPSRAAAARGADVSVDAAPAAGGS